MFNDGLQDPLFPHFLPRSVAAEICFLRPRDVEWWPMQTMLSRSCRWDMVCGRWFSGWETCHRPRVAEAWGAGRQPLVSGDKKQPEVVLPKPTEVGAGIVGESVAAKGCYPRQRGGGRKIPVSPFLLLLAALGEPAGKGARDTDPREGRAWGGLTASEPTPARADTSWTLQSPDYLYFARADGCCLGLPQCSWFWSWTSS